MFMKKLTEIQTNLYAILKRQFGTKKARGIISQEALECYDWRSLRGLFDRGLLTWDSYGRARIEVKK